MSACSNDSLFFAEEDSSVLMLEVHADKAKKSRKKNNTAGFVRIKHVQDKRSNAEKGQVFLNM